MPIDNLQHGVYLAALREALNRHDPIGLIEGGVPVDEYDSERSLLASRLLKCQNIEEAVTVTHEVFRELFGRLTAGRKASYCDLAAELFTIAQRWRPQDDGSK